MAEIFTKDLFKKYVFVVAYIDDSKESNPIMTMVFDDDEAANKMFNHIVSSKKTINRLPIRHNYIIWD